MRLTALAARYPISLVIGIDVGDRSRTHGDRQVVSEGVMATKSAAVFRLYQGVQRRLMVLEMGTDLRWVAQLLAR